MMYFTMYRQVLKQNNFFHKKSNSGDFSWVIFLLFATFSSILYTNKQIKEGNKNYE